MILFKNIVPWGFSGGHLGFMLQMVLISQLCLGIQQLFIDMMTTPGWQIDKYHLILSTVGLRNLEGMIAVLHNHHWADCHWPRLPENRMTSGTQTSKIWKKWGYCQAYDLCQQVSDILLILQTKMNSIPLPMTQQHPLKLKLIVLIADSSGNAVKRTFIEE